MAMTKAEKADLERIKNQLERAEKKIATLQNQLAFYARMNEVLEGVLDLSDDEINVIRQSVQKEIDGAS